MRRLATALIEHCSACGGDHWRRDTQDVFGIRPAVGITVVWGGACVDLFEFNGDIWLVY